MSDNTYRLYIKYKPSGEGPANFVARQFHGEARPHRPDEKRIRAAIERAYRIGYQLRDRYDDPMKRRTRLIFRPRPHAAYIGDPSTIHPD